MPPSGVNRRTPTGPLCPVRVCVGDSVVTNLDLEEALIGWESQTRQQRPTDPAQRIALARELLQGRIDQLLLLQAAVRDTTVRVPDEQINGQVDERITQLQGAAPQFSLGKSFPGFGPTGPWLVTPDEFADRDAPFFTEAAPVTFPTGAYHTAELPYPSAMKGAIMTAPEHVGVDARRRLDLIVGHVLGR